MDVQNLSVEDMSQYVARFKDLKGSKDSYIDDHLPGHERFKINLIGMGVLPLQFMPGDSARSLGLTGHEIITIKGVEALNDGMIREVEVIAEGDDGRTHAFTAIVRIDTPGEADYYRHGGILQYVLRSLAR